MASCNFDPMITAEMYGQILGFDKKRKKTALWEHFKRSLRDAKDDAGNSILDFVGCRAYAPGAVAGGLDANVNYAVTFNQSHTYNEEVAKENFYNWYTRAHKNAANIARRRLRALMMSKEDNSPMASLIRMQSLNPTKKITKPQLMAMASMGGKSIVKIQALGIMMGFDDIEELELNTCADVNTMACR